MNCTNAHRKIFVFRTTESSRFDHFLKVFLFWKLPDALHQVLIGLPLTGQNLAHRRDHGE